MKSKDTKECEEHYFSFYYKSKDDCLPRQEDFIVKGQRTIKNGQPHVEIDETKIEKALKKVRQYQEKRKSEIEEEEREFAP